MPDPRRFSADDLRQVARDQLALVQAHAVAGSLVAAAFAVLLALKLRGGAYPAPWFDGWLALKLAVGLYRSAAAWRGQRNTATAPTANVVDFWLAVDGAIWGLGGFAMMSATQPVASLVGAVLASVSCAATFGLQVRARSTAAYVLPILVPTALALLLRNDDFGWVGGSGLLMLLGLQLLTARRSERRLVEGMLLRLQSQSLVREKEDALQLALRQSAVKTQFLANISHELRTPLHGILGLARVVRHEHQALHAQDAELLHRLELIESSGTHLLALINDLLDISRIEAGRFVMRAEAFDLGPQVEQVAAVHALRAREKGLRFEHVSSLPQPLWVLGDAARYRQVLHNLLGNAVKFTEQGGVTLRLSRARRTDGDLVTAEVHDSGPGISEAESTRVFEAFHQSAGASAQPTDGAGLGLAIARDIAREMGGDIVLQPPGGVGSTLQFTALLPTASAPPAPPATAARPLNTDALAAPPAVIGHGARPTTVLVAEDDEVNALIVLAYLAQLGAHASRVHDGAAALAATRACADAVVTRPDLVLMDCRMPVLDGFAATRAIRAEEAAQGWPRLPVIALTATAGDTDRQQCLDAGMDDFLVKPYTRDELAAVLARWAPPN